MKKILMVLMMVLGTAAFAKDYTVTEYSFNPVTLTMESYEITMSLDYSGKFVVNDITGFEYIDADHVSEDEISMNEELVPEDIIKDGKTVYSFVRTFGDRTTVFDYVFFSNGDIAVRTVEVTR